LQMSHQRRVSNGNNPGQSLLINELELTKEKSATPSPSMRAEFMAEFIGTMVLVTFGIGVNAQVLLGHGNTGDWDQVTMAWGAAVVFGIFATGGVSAAHLNPAVTLSQAVFQGFPWRKVPIYMLAQLLGSFFGAGAVFTVYYSAFDDYTKAFTGGKWTEATAGVFGTFPKQFVNDGAGFWDQVVGTALLCFGVSMICDIHSPAGKLSDSAKPFFVGLLLMVIGMTFGLNAGYAINPARDLGPRLFTMFFRWGTDVFVWDHSWWWVPIVGPLVGGLFGSLWYYVFITYPRRW